MDCAVNTDFSMLDSSKETSRMQKTSDATSTVSQNPEMEMKPGKFSDTQHTQESIDHHYSSDCDPLTACGPYSNCPCSVHTKHSISDDEEIDVPMRRASLLGDEDNFEDSINAIKSDTVGVLSLDTVKKKHSLKPNVSKKSTNRSSPCDPEALTDAETDNTTVDEEGLYTEDRGPKMYQVKAGTLVTPPIITKNLPELFKFLPIFGKPINGVDVKQFQNEKVREYVGCDLNDEEFYKLAKFCSPNHLKTGNELKMAGHNPTYEPLSEHIPSTPEMADFDGNLRIVKQLRLRMDRDSRQVYTKRLKYRGIKLVLPPQDEDSSPPCALTSLEPGKELVFRVRVYRPHSCRGSKRYSRHSVFCNDVVLLGRQKLTALRDRLVCPNDMSIRVDVSQNPDEQPETFAKDLFPSAFLFINNVFYVDTREGCVDYSAPIREWARKRKLGVFPRRDMSQVSFDQLLVRLGHPEVYVHLGNCEHLFTFSEVRLLNVWDPLREALYPFHTAISTNQTTYCSTCAEHVAKWIVTGCSRVPFDPAYFCKSCFESYLYKDGKKLGDFKAYKYRGNEIKLQKLISKEKRAPIESQEPIN